jgi:hypothetical protein
MEFGVSGVGPLVSGARRLVGYEKYVTKFIITLCKES